MRGNPENVSKSHESFSSSKSTGYNDVNDYTAPQHSETWVNVDPSAATNRQIRCWIFICWKSAGKKLSHWIQCQIFC